VHHYHILWDLEKMPHPNYDLIVIGGGHAGCEAALASARLGLTTLLVTLQVERIAHTPCNPAVGGLAKGHLVKEIDALGGEIGRLTDQSAIQFRMLNRAKGPAVWSPRAQVDKALHHQVALAALEAQENLDIIEGEVETIQVNHYKFEGVTIRDGAKIAAQACVVTAGTFLNGLMHIGPRKIEGGREGDPPSAFLSDYLRSEGFTVGRLKTGTPPRLLRESVDLSLFERQDGDVVPVPFSHRTAAIQQTQVPCYLTHTNERTHEIIRKNLSRSPLFSGEIKGVGPRYCPSIEDKVVRFPEKSRHQLFIEPEGREHPELYVNGLSTSMPEDVQLQFLKTIPGFENVVIQRPGYAVEYDFFPPDQIYRTMESKKIERLYFAGQVNGTSGYEEAAAQGFVAAINAAFKLRDREPFVLGRDEAYIGVLVDDLTTKEIDEPYRMFTSRAEFRLLLRQDNADERLMKYGHSFGLVSSKAWDEVRDRTDRVEQTVEALKQKTFPAQKGNALFETMGLEQVQKPVSVFQVLRRPEVRFHHIEPIVELDIALGENEKTQAESAVKYSGYIERQQQDIHFVREMESRLIPEDFSYEEIPGLSTEARQKLTSKRPETVGHASRMSGVRASDLSIIVVQLEKRRRAAARGRAEVRYAK
jgi:tRNA uridine 5-carboxymethylaminomethyl modification enzyme